MAVITHGARDRIHLDAANIGSTTRNFNMKVGAGVRTCGKFR